MESSSIVVPMAVLNQRPFALNDTSFGPIRTDDGGTNNERNGLNRMTALIVAILGSFLQGIHPSPFETHYKVVVGTLIVVLIYMITSIIHSQLRPKSILYSIVGDIELFSQLLIVPLFILMLVPILGLISLVLWAFSLPIWIVMQYFSNWLVPPRVLGDRATVAISSFRRENLEERRLPV